MGLKSEFFANFVIMNTKMDIIVVVILAALALFQSCNYRGGTNHYDKRLSKADSLMRANNPDSALQVLEAINASRLDGAANRAYHALLLTQAQYRCYVDINSDSTINVALNYYKHHRGEQEKLTRAYIYKGVVTEVMGEPEAAMAIYKQAISIAAPDDHFNLGYTKMRIGSLYSDHLVADSSDIVFFKAALHHFEQVPDSFYIANCMSMIGRSYNANSQVDSSLIYLERASDIAHNCQEMDLEMSSLSYLADLKMYSSNRHDIELAKSIVLSILESSYCPSTRRDHLKLVAAYTLARLNMVDSASLYLSQIKEENLNDELKVFYHDCCAEIAQCCGDIDLFKKHNDTSHHLADSLVTNNLQQRLREVETKFDNEELEKQSLQYRNRWLMSLLGISLLVIVIIAMKHYINSRSRELQERQDTIERLRDDVAQLTPRLIALKTLSDELKDTIRHQVEVYTQLVEKFASEKEKAKKDFNKAFEQSYSISNMNESFWVGLRTYVNSQYNNIIDESIATYPALNKTDINYLALYCCGLPTSVIMACMGYKEAHSAYNKKRRVAEAMNLQAGLDSYIMQYNSIDQIIE